MDVADLVRASEGKRAQTYDDSSGRVVNAGDVCQGVLTIGYGHTSSSLTPGDVWTDAQIESALYADLSAAEQGARQVVGAACWNKLNDARRAALIDMTYNLGARGFRKFVGTVAAVRKGEWERAATLMLASRWAGQVGHRAARDAEIIRTGNFPKTA